MRKLLISSIFLFSIQSHAGLLVEPVIGYNITGVEFKSGGQSYGTAAQGLMYGGRIGWTAPAVFFIAFDYMTGDLDWEPENGVNTEITGTQTRSGVTIGADVPVAPLRLWAGYYKTSFDPKASGIASYDFDDGDGFKVGVGLTFLPIIDINLEYFSGEYDNYKENGVVVDQKAEDAGVMLSLSTPFDF